VPIARPELIQLPRRPGEIVTPRHDGGGAVTRLACGYLAIDRRLCAGLLEALPRVLRVDSRSGELSAWLNASLRMSLVEHHGEEPGRACVLAKLSELMFVEAIRRYVESLPPGQANWLAGLKDPHVGRALARLHREPARGWTVDALARDVGLSRSALAERFTNLVGRSPMQYLTHWRLTLAAHLLKTTGRPASSIAFEIGYESEAAFNRAFKREFGAPPSAWRRQLAAVASSTTDSVGKTARALPREGLVAGEVG
jgi:AraC-like DNA-binding protein